MHKIFPAQVYFTHWITAYLRCYFGSSGQANHHQLNKRIANSVETHKPRLFVDIYAQRRGGIGSFCGGKHHYQPGAEVMQTHFPAGLQMCRTTRDYYSYPTAKAKGERNLSVSVITAERGIFARCKSSEMAFITGEACRLWLRSEDNDSCGINPAFQLSLYSSPSGARPPSLHQPPPANPTLAPQKEALLSDNAKACRRGF